MTTVSAFSSPSSSTAPATLSMRLCTDSSPIDTVLGFARVRLRWCDGFFFFFEPGTREFAIELAREPSPFDSTLDLTRASLCDFGLALETTGRPLCLVECMVEWNEETIDGFRECALEPALEPALE